MKAKLMKLVEHRTALVARAATQRAGLSQTLAPWRGRLAVVDEGLVGRAISRITLRYWWG